MSLEGCAHVSDTGVAELAKMSTGLTYLNISRCERVGEYGDRALIQLGRSCHKLKGLDAFGCSHAQVEMSHFDFYSVKAFTRLSVLELVFGEISRVNRIVRMCFCLHLVRCIS